MATAANLDQTLLSLFEAERRVRNLHDEISDGDPAEVLGALERAVPAALKESSEEESSLRLERLALLLGELEGPRPVDLLIDIVASDLPQARNAAGEMLEGLAFDRFKEVAKGIERALKRLPAGSPALPELPYVIADIPEPGVGKLLEQFLKHEDADAVAAAIEVGVEIGDPGFAKHLVALKNDSRTVEMSDEAGEPAEVTLGELAADALDILSEAEGAGDGDR
jgi:hypothetical protein